MPVVSGAQNESEPDTETGEVLAGVLRGQTSCEATDVGAQGG